MNLKNSLIGIILSLVICNSCSGDKTMNHKAGTIRRTYGDGRWFPAGRAELDKMIDGFIEGAAVAKVDGRIIGGIAPHAGYIYSGPVDGYTFRALRDNYKEKESPECVVILGFSHSTSFAGVALMDGDAIRSPLGVTVLDKESAGFLVSASDRIRFDYRPHMGEHSAENLVPFVQKSLLKAKLVVALMGDHEDASASDLAAALNKLATRRRIVVLASTDLLHDPDYDKVTRSDKVTLEEIVTLDEAGLAGTWSYDNQVCCGIMPVLTLMKFVRLQGVEKGEILGYRNSGDDHPESRGNWVVGYGSVIFSKQLKKGDENGVD